MTDELSLEKINPTKTELLALANEARKLTIKDINDKEGYALVHEHRIKLKNARVQITKTGKMVRDDAIAFQKKVIVHEKELVAIIEPIEKDLEAKEKAFDEAKEMERRKALIPERQTKLDTLGIIADESILLSDNEKFNAFINEKTAKQLAEKEAKIKAEQERMETEKRKIEETKRIEKAKKQAEKESHEKALRDAELAKIKAQQEKETAIKAEREKAEREKRRIIEEQERKEREAKEVEERRIAQEKAEKEALEKKKKYQNFLDKHGYKDDGNFKVERIGNKVILYKKLGELKV